MFILDGKSFFGNTGLFISFIILIVILYLSYNKCYYNVELFEGPNKPEPTDVRVNIAGSSVSINFSIDNNEGNIMPDKFIIILSQYDSNLKNTGNNQFYVSNEYELKTSILVDEKIADTNSCNIINGKPMCQHKFNNLPITDINGNPFYYKLGVAAVYSNQNTRFIMPYNITTQNKLFTLQSTAEEQSRQFTDFTKFKKEISKVSQPSAAVYDKTMANADGSYELIKSQLDGYPDNLILDEQSINQQTLKDLVDKNLAPAIVDIKLSP
jgi:hypothetical protein